MIKCQSFGFDLLLIIIVIAFFSQFTYYSFIRDDSPNYFLQRGIENHELLRAVLGGIIHWRILIAMFHSIILNA